MNKNQGKHFILTNGRCGSNFFVNLINEHPELTNYGEVLGDWTVAYQAYQRGLLKAPSDEEYLDALYDRPRLFYVAQTYSAVARIKRAQKPRWKWRNKVHSVGVKDFHTNLSKRNMEQYFSRRQSIRIVFLTRKNVLDRYLSNFLLETTKVIADRRATEKQAGTESPSCSHIPIDGLLDGLDKIAHENDELEQFAATLPERNVFRIVYEDYFGSPERSSQVNNQLLEFLDVKVIDLMGEHRRIGGRPVKNRISNMDEVTEALRGSRHECWLS